MPTDCTLQLALRVQKQQKERCEPQANSLLAIAKFVRDSGQALLCESEELFAGYDISDPLH
jgi:hypothetical protein